ncbi:MAG: DUF2914 domain-containing protein [Gammaproteobacteria bacterium]|nr:DUF2914 domain-containing protein [Gammaproteobacteria bacterium]
MQIRKRRTGRASRSLTDHIAIGAMALSAFLIALSVIATDRSASPGPASQAQAEEPGQQLAKNPADQRGAPAGGGAASRHADANDTAVRDGPAGAGFDSANSNADARSPTASESAGAEPVDTAGSEMPATDIAAMESVPDNSSSASVVRAQFTTGIDNSQPVNSINSVFSTQGQVFSLDGRPLSKLYYFTEISAERGEKIVHRWEHEGEVVAQASFDVGGDSSPIYSSEELPPATPGNWRVVVTDAQGNVIRADRFSYQAY